MWLRVACEAGRQNDEVGEESKTRSSCQVAGHLGAMGSHDKVLSRKGV